MRKEELCLMGSYCLKIDQPERPHTYIHTLISCTTRRTVGEKVVPSLLPSDYRISAIDVQIPEAISSFGLIRRHNANSWLPTCACRSCSVHWMWQTPRRACVFFESSLICILVYLVIHRLPCIYNTGAWQRVCINVRIKTVQLNLVDRTPSASCPVINAVVCTSRVNPMTLKHCSTASNCSL